MRQSVPKNTYNQAAIAVVVLALLCASVSSFSSTTFGSSQTRSLSSLNSSTKSKVDETMEQSSDTNNKFPTYTDAQLKAALDGLLEGSKDPAFDGRHLFGFNDPDHQLSKLQSITATRILDYETFLVSKATFESYQFSIDMFSKISSSAQTFHSRLTRQHQQKLNCEKSVPNLPRNMVHC